MKKSILIPSLCVIAILNSSFTYAHAESKDELLNKYLAADRQIHEVYYRAGLTSAKIKVSTLIHQEKSEVVTKTEKTDDSESGNNTFSALFGLVKFNFRGFLDLFNGFDARPNSKEKTRIDYTQIINTNSAQVARQEAKANSQLAQLKKELAKIYIEHEFEITNMKVLGLIYAKAAYSLMQAGGSVDLDQTLSTLNLTQEVSFSGEQTVTRCITLTHAETKSYDRKSTNSNIKLNFLGLVAFSSSNVDRHDKFVKTYEYADESCSSTTNQVKANPNETVYFVNLKTLDSEIEKWIDVLEKAQVVQNETVTVFPTWNSSYFQ